MTIQEISEKIKLGAELYVVFIIVLVSFASFGLGRLSVKTDVSNTIYPSITSAQVALPEISASNIEVSEEKYYIASKNGTVYHLPWCPGAGRIKDENKIWFESKEDAENAGYRPAANCKGL